MTHSKHYQIEEHCLVVAASQKPAARDCRVFLNRLLRITGLAEADISVNDLAHKVASVRIKAYKPG